MPRKKKTMFIMDTNVILHDSACIYHFGEHNVVIPVTVLEELEQFKKGSEILNFHAREFIRTLDMLCGEQLFNGGVPIDRVWEKSTSSWTGNSMKISF